MVDLQPGTLLVATPTLLDPHFADTVVMLLDADDNGVLGVVLNRPSPVAVGAVLPPWASYVTGGDVLFTGGPVGPDGALAVALLRDQGVASPVGFRRVVGRFGLVDLDTPTELVAESLAGLRIFAGYAGWGAGQFSDEVDEGAWYVVPGLADDVFRPVESVRGVGGVDRLRRDVLRRQPGDLAWHSTRPVDADLN